MCYVYSSMLYLSYIKTTKRFWAILKYRLKFHQIKGLTIFGVVVEKNRIDIDEDKGGHLTAY